MPLVSKTFADIITFTRASTGTYFNSAGTLTSAAINEPRLDYNPSTLAAQGLLIEESRANLCLQSEDFSTTWTVAGTATITTNQLTSPAGTLTADLLTTPTGGPNRVQQAGTAVVSTTYAASVFVKVGNVNGLTLRVLFSGGTLVDTFADFIFSSATFSGINGAGVFSSQNCGNGWYRLTCVIASGNNTSWDFRVGGLIGTAQTGTTAYVWGAQIEAGAFPTSYIPTSTIALTRAADVASVNTLSPWFNASEGTLYTEVTTPQTFSYFPIQAMFHDGTSSNYLASSIQSSGAPRFERAAAGVIATPMNASPVLSAGVLLKQATAFAVNNFALVANGGTPVTSATGNMPTVTTLRIGGYINATTVGNLYNGYIRRISYYPRRLSDAELQSLTT